jgi:FAD/FMN-containing dehydrogenase/Fe-S oxidoreductase
LRRFAFLAAGYRVHISPIADEGEPTSGRKMDPSADGRTLEADLREQVGGEVRFSDGDRALYSTDASNYRQIPIGVVVPRDSDDVIAAVRVCAQHGAPILPRGGGTSLAGQSCNVAVVIDCSKYLREVIAIDPSARTARVRPGTVLDELQASAAPYGLMFGPDPATHDRCTIGGMLGNNSCGIHSVMAGRTEDNVVSLDVLTSDGLQLTLRRADADASTSRSGGRAEALHRSLRAIAEQHADAIRDGFPRIPRRVSGYNLPQLLPEQGPDLARAVVGSEGTCVTILEATLRLVPAPAARSLVVLGYRDVYTAAAEVPAIMSHEPIGLEGIDEVLAEDMRRKGMHPDELAMMPQGPAWLLAEFGGDSKEASDDAARDLLSALGRRPDDGSSELYDDPEREGKVWEIRESGLGATARVPGQGDTWPGWEDSAVPPERLDGYLRDLRGLYDRFGYHAALYGHFGQGCVHTRIDFELETAPGIGRFRSFVEEAADLVVAYGGSLSGEHGDGQARGELLSRMYPEEILQAFRAFKAAWDPAGLMNPGKVIDAHRVDQDLRLGADYRPRRVRTAFRYPDDGGSLAKATLRCVGVGKCRRTDGGVMCPSFMVTHEEQHSTRGRARLLFEMLEGDPLREGWRQDAVEDALDLCLSCKGCKRDCPVSVDMATYKAEFLSHHYAGRVRPRQAYALGLIPWAARLASRAPALANALLGHPVTGRIAKLAGGIAAERTVPSFAEQTFVAWFRDHVPLPSAGTRGTVVLWPDTFNDHWHPDTGRAAVEVLEGAGYRLAIPPRWVCCGRPLYDFGMLDLARSTLRRDLEILRPALRLGLPVVGLEPSCVAVFRDELGQLFPDDPDAHRLASQTCTLAELLGERTPGWDPPQLQGRAIVQTHCHHHAVMGFEADRKLLERTGLDVQVLDSGCCGMAGAFGFEDGHYDVSIAIGERVLLPAVREARDAIVIADGFSCREQIGQGAGRRAWHLAEVLAGRAVGPAQTGSAHEGQEATR